MYSVHDVAKYALAFATDQGYPLTNLHLQKILYYIQGYSFRKFSEEAFSEQLYHWKYGPVSPNVYYDYCVYVRNPISINNPSDEMCSSPIYNDKGTRKLIEDIVDKCRYYKASDLVDKTHKEKPWATTGEMAIIAKDKIKSFFLDNDPLEFDKDGKDGRARRT